MAVFRLAAVKDSRNGGLFEQAHGGEWSLTIRQARVGSNIQNWPVSCRGQPARRLGGFGTSLVSLRLASPGPKKASGRWSGKGEGTCLAG
jgi:hypothetical protein